MICVLLMFISGATTSLASVSCGYERWHPRTYSAYHVSENSITIDGILNDTVWEESPWSEPFMDIQGSHFWSQPWYQTKIKMRYDNTNLYVAAYLEETALWANSTRRNSVVFHDNDFEIFVDVDGTTHNYKEFEVNVLNTTWNLLLNKPYRNGGHENSTRVDPVFGFDMFGKGLSSATFTNNIPVNDISQRPKFWTIEVALPLRELVRYTRLEGQGVPPTPNTAWRINFSRVEWPIRINSQTHQYEKVIGIPESNWVWSPQYEIAMHKPEMWGYVHFRIPETHSSYESNHMPNYVDREWNVRFLSFQFYYAQVAFRAQYGHYATILDDNLLKLFPIQPAISCFHLVSLVISSEGNSYCAELSDDLYVASIHNDGYLVVVPVKTVAEE